MKLFLKITLSILLLPFILIFGLFVGTFHIYRTIFEDEGDIY